MLAAQGAAAGTRLTIPRLRVRRDWFVGLAPDHVDHSKPDVGTGQQQQREQQQQQQQQQGQQQQGQQPGQQKQQAAAGAGDQVAASVLNAGAGGAAQQQGATTARRRLLQAEVGGAAAGGAQQAQQAAAGQQGQQGQQAAGLEALGVEEARPLTDEAADSFGELFAEEGGEASQKDEAAERKEVRWRLGMGWAGWAGWAVAWPAASWAGPAGC